MIGAVTLRSAAIGIAFAERLRIAIQIGAGNRAFYEGELVGDVVFQLSNCVQQHVTSNIPALALYKKMGFEVVAEEDLAIGNGYLMEDYKMEKKI